MSASLDFIDGEGCLVCEMILHPLDGGMHTLRKISRDEADAFGEEPVQLLEGESYQYQLTRKDFQLAGVPGVVRKLVSTGDGLEVGLISPGLFVGRLELTVQINGVDHATAAVEVCSRKLDFRTEYRTMLDDVSNASIDLLMSLSSPSETRITVDSSVDAESAQQMFFFLRSLIGGEEFSAAIKRIVSSPHTMLSSTDLEQPINRIGRADSSVLRQIAYKNPRMAVPALHPLSTKIPNLPRTITRKEHVETVDTNENRFVKFALVQMRDFLHALLGLLGRGKKADREFGIKFVAPLASKIEEFLHHAFFSDVGQLTDFSVVSPVLQRKSGYREVLTAWVRFNSGAALSWNAARDVFGVGVKNAAVLYEYWVFFLLISVFDPWIKDRSEVARSVLKPNKNSLSLGLKYGEVLEVDGLRMEHAGVPWRVRFFFNKTYSAGQTIASTGRLDYLSSPKGEAWTRRMRPDFSFMFYPDGLTLEEAVNSEMFAQLHFDAKYSLSSLTDVFGKEQEEPICGGAASDYSRTDLLKMHTYKDAIRRASGSYILYPGADVHGGHQIWKEFHEVLPGLGAFSVKPDGINRGSELLRLFFLDVLDQLANVSS